jgi:hypothetical protein
MTDLDDPRNTDANRDELRELVGHDVPSAELERLREVDAVLRSVPAPPADVPSRLTHAVVARAQPRGLVLTRRRTLAAVALAATLCALFFGLGTRVGDGDDFQEVAAYTMEPGEAAPGGAAATIRLGEQDAHGNWPLRLEVSGLPKLPDGSYYVLWLAKDGEYGATCGSFAVTGDEAEVGWDVSYRLRDFDTWVVTARRPNQPPDEDPPWLLQARVDL